MASLKNAVVRLRNLKEEEKKLKTKKESTALLQSELYDSR